jgi:two-component system response regulator TctD
MTAHMTSTNELHRSPRLLLVEDDADVRLFMVMALGAEGYDVTSAADAHQALRELSFRTFDLVLTDFGLPGKDGLMLLDEARGKGLLRGAKVVMLTAFPWLARDTEIPILPKPVDFDDLNGRLRQILEIPSSSTPAHR